MSRELQAAAIDALNALKNAGVKPLVQMGLERALMNDALASAESQPSVQELAAMLQRLTRTISDTDMLPAKEQWYQDELADAVALLSRMESGK